MAAKLKKRTTSHRQSRSDWSYKIHMIAVSCKDALIWSLTPGQAGDSPEGRKLVEAIDAQDSAVYLLMDSAYDSDDLLATAANRSLIPVVPAQPQRKSPWIPDK